MKITWVPMIAQVLGTFLHVLWCFLFTKVWRLGVIGLGIATNLTNFTILAVILINSSCVGEISKAIICPNREALRNWGRYLRIALPATVLLCAEWWAHEILTFMAGILGVREQAA